MKKRYWLVILCAAFALMVVALLPFTMHTAHAEGETSGQCGDNLYWSFDESTGTLTISGSGEMQAYDDTNVDAYTLPEDYIPGWNPYKEQIVHISFAEGATSIGLNAFRGLTNLTDVLLPDSMIKIEEGAFEACTALTEITFPQNVAKINFYAFDECTNLRAFHVAPGNSVYSDADGALLSADGTILYRYPLGGTSCTIPNTVTCIGENAFSDCSRLETVTIPDSVTTIEDGAFYECTALTEITIPDSVTEAGIYTFENCTSLRSVTLGDSLKKTGTAMFSTCSSLTEIHFGKGIETIGYCSFIECTALETLVIPDSVKEIEIGAFADCTSLKNVTLGNGVVYLSGFSGCTSLESIVIPDSVEVLYETFYDCTALTSVKLSKNLLYMWNWCFGGCENLTTITIPDGVESMGWNEFNGCTSLQSIYLPASLTEIEENSFADCSALSDVYYSGTETQRAEMTVKEGNNALLNATWHYQTGFPIEGTVEWNAEDVKFKGTTAYVIANGKAQTPRFTVKNEADGSVIDPMFYDYEYKENTKAGTGYVFVTFKSAYEGTCRGTFKIYLQPTTTTTVANIKDGIKLTWSKVEGADGYVIYRRAWSSTTNGWTDFVRWNNTTALNWTDTKVYAGTRYQYGIKAYFNRRLDPVTNTYIGGNVGDNFNLGEVGPLKTTVRITTRTLNSVTAGTKQMTVKWGASSVFTGYQIKYATDKNFTKKVVAIKITDPKTAQTVIKNLTSGTTYYVTVRSYHEFNGMTYFGEWSNVLSCKVK